MSGFNGRDLTIDWSTTTLATVRTKGYTINNEYVDVTNDDDGGYRTYLAKPGVTSVEVSVAGITSDETLIEAITDFANGDNSDTLDINLPSSLATPGDITGTFLIQSLEHTGEHDGAVEFSATFVSSGEFTYTASSA